MLEWRYYGMYTDDCGTGTSAVNTIVLLLHGEIPNCWVNFRGIDRENVSDMVIRAHQGALWAPVGRPIIVAVGQNGEVLDVKSWGI